MTSNYIVKKIIKSSYMALPSTPNNLSYQKEFIFEVLVIDKNGATGITKDKSLLDALSYSEKLWKNKEIIGINKIVDKDQLIEIKIHSIDTQSALTELIDSGFVLIVKGHKFEEMEKFRHSLLIHLKGKLGFTNIRILNDDISTKISNDIYPLINKVENILRRYLILFFTQKIGVDWWSSTAPGGLSDKIKLRKNNEQVFSPLCDTDVTLIDFDDLGELIYKQTSGFNRQENILSRIMNSNSMEDLNILKEELQSNYTKYFKEAFQDKNFDKKWKGLFEIRNKVAHNNLFILNDYSTASLLVEELSKIINDAESKIDTFKFSLGEQEAIRQNTIEAVKAAEQQKELKEPRFNLKIIGKIDLPEDEHGEDDNYGYDNSFRIITEEELLYELQLAERNAPKRGMAYVGLKSFVSKLLGSKGFAVGPTYSLVNILNDKEIIEIYDVEDAESYYQPKAIRSKKLH